MERRSGASMAVPAVLYFVTAISVLTAVQRAIEVPLGAMPADAARFEAAPYAMWLHGLAGAMFGLLGPVQFSRAIRHRFGALHRGMGRVFVAAGAVLGLSGLRLAEKFGGQIDATDMARVAFGALLLVCLWQAIARIRTGDRDGHRAWMIRSYAVGMGSAPLAFIYFPMFIAMGALPAPGPLDHAIFVGVWLGSIAAGEAVIRRLSRRAASYSAA